MTGDSDAILRYLEDKPQDAAARRALHDALMDEGRDEVLTAGVHWLVVNGIWVDGSATSRHTAPHMRFSIATPLELGIDRRPFNDPTYGSTVQETLRAFSAYLWGFRVWVNEQLFGDRPVGAAKKAKMVPLAPPFVGNMVPLDSYEDPFFPWRPTSVHEPKVTWTSPRPSTSDGGGDLWYYDNVTGARMTWPVTRADTKKD